MRRLGILAAAILGLCLTSAAWAEAEDTEREGGILGTGIVGTITALGSIYVNGQHILFDDGMAVENLLPGHTVAVLAHLEGSEWRARDIRQILPLVGPAQVSPDGQLTIMGTRVLTADGMASDIATGDWVAISGLWQAGQVIATRVDRVSDPVNARIEGTVFDTQSDRPLRLGGTEITGLRPQHLQDGDVIRVTGKPAEDGLQVSQLETGVFASAPGMVLIEGYFSAPQPSGLYTVLGSNIVSYTDSPEMIDPLAKQLICSSAGIMVTVDITSMDPGNLVEIPAECVDGTMAPLD